MARNHLLRRYDMDATVCSLRISYVIIDSNIRIDLQTEPVRVRQITVVRMLLNTGNERRQANSSFNMGLNALTFLETSPQHT